MSTAAQKIAALIPKLRPAERRTVRALLDAADFKTWTEDTVKFRQLTRRRTVKFPPAK